MNGDGDSVAASNSWRSACGPAAPRTCIGRQMPPLTDLALSSFLESSLPYADDSDAMTIASISCKVFDDTDNGDDDVCCNSVTGSVLSTPTNNWGINGLAPPPPPQQMRQDHLRPRDHWRAIGNGTNGNYEDSLSRKNSYCSHGSHWSYSSHADPMLLLYRSASRSGGYYYDRPVTEEVNVAIVEKEIEAAAEAGGYLSSNNMPNSSDEFMIPPDYLVSPPTTVTAD